MTFDIYSVAQRRHMYVAFSMFSQTAVVNM